MGFFTAAPAPAPSAVVTGLGLGLGLAVGSARKVLAPLARHSLGAPVGAAAAAAAAAGAASPVVIDMTTSGSPAAAAAAAFLPAAAPFDDVRFERDLQGGMTMGDISRSLRERYRGRPTWMARRQRRPLKVLSVTVSGAGNAFGPETYSEIKEVRVDRCAFGPSGYAAYRLHPGTPTPSLLRPQGAPLARLERHPRPRPGTPTNPSHTPRLPSAAD